MIEKTPTLQLRGVSKSFPGVQALTDIDLAAYAGETLCLLGDNGAGKSTLIKVLAYNTSVAGLNRSGAVYAKAGEVRLLTATEIPRSYRPERDEHITLWEVAMDLEPHRSTRVTSNE